MDTQERRTLAIRVSQSIAQNYGVQNGTSKVLKDTNHTVVHLWPSPVVAKVSTKETFLHRREGTLCIDADTTRHKSAIERADTSRMYFAHVQDGIGATIPRAYPEFFSNLEIKF